MSHTCKLLLRHLMRATSAFSALLLQSCSGPPNLRQEREREDRGKIANQDLPASLRCLHVCICMCESGAREDAVGRVKCTDAREKTKKKKGKKGGRGKRRRGGEVMFCSEKLLFLLLLCLYMCV